jgi:hypothetical protein
MEAYFNDGELRFWDVAVARFPIPDRATNV